MGKRYLEPTHSDGERHAGDSDEGDAPSVCQTYGGPHDEGHRILDTEAPRHAAQAGNFLGEVGPVSGEGQLIDSAMESKGSAKTPRLHKTHT